jgi:hypothetical protein
VLPVALWCGDEVDVQSGCMSMVILGYTCEDDCTPPGCRVIVQHGVAKDIHDVWTVSLRRDMQESYSLVKNMMDHPTDM